MADSQDLPGHLETWAAYLESAAEDMWPLARTAIDPGSAALVASAALRVRTSRLLRACAHLVRCGYAIETAGLVRSIWEDALSAAYIAESPEERGRQWIDYSEARRGFHLRETFNNPARITDSSLLPQIGQALEGMDVSTSHYWTGLGPSVVARDLLGSSDRYRALLGRDFATYYAALCDDTHGSPYAVGQLLAPGSGTARVNAGPTADRTGELAPLALYGAWQIAHSLASFGADVDADALKAIVEEVHAKFVRAASSG